MNDQQSPGQQAYEEAQQKRKEKFEGKGNGANTIKIKIIDGKLLRIVKQAERAILADTDQHVFQRGGILVHIKRIPKETTTKGITRAANSLIIEPATPETVRCEMARTAAYQRFNKKENKWLPTDPPLKYAKSFAARDQWALKPLLGTIEAPTLRADGSILQTPGYDPASWLYFKSSGRFPEINSNPSKDQAYTALQKLGNLLKDFPFTEAASLSVALSAQLTALVRRSLPSAPMFLFDAPVQGSGKSLLARLVAHIATGRNPAMQPYTGDQEEDRKRIIATLIAGDAVVCFDNVVKAMQNATLSQALVEAEVTDRLLGTMINVRVPTCSTFMANGNNIEVNGRDLGRRVLKCRIDPGIENPEERTFDYVLLDRVAEQRVELVVAGLTIMRAYITAGRPDQKRKTFGSFEAWSDMVRAPLVWLGMDDPCSSRTEVADSDPETQKFSELLAALADKYKPINGNACEFTVAEVVGQVRSDARDMQQYSSNPTALYEAATAICYRGEVTSAAIGLIFRKFRDRVADGRKLVRGSSGHASAQRWKIEAV